MKILFVNMFYNEAGGAQKSTKFLAEQLVKEGHEVFAYSDDAIDSDIDEVINRVKIFRRRTPLFSLHYIFSAKKNPAKHFFYKIFETYNVFAKRKFINIIEEVQPDIVHFNTISGMSLSIVKEAKKRNIRTVWTLRDYWLEYSWGEKDISLIKLLNRIYRPFVKKSLRHLDIVTAPSAFTLNNFINKGFINPSSQKCMVIENAVIFSKGKLENIIKQKQETKRNPEKTNFLFVGSILEIKGVFNLVKAFKKLTSPEISLKIVGKGKDLEKLQKEIESDPRIQYLGFQDTETLYKTYQNSDVLVVPSAWDEPFGRVVIEGNANGLPVITSDRGGLPEIVQTVGGGEIFTDESGNTLYSLLKKFVEMENYNVYYQCILENIDIYSIEKQSEKFTNLYLDKEIE